MMSFCVTTMTGSLVAGTPERTSSLLAGPTKRGGAENNGCWTRYTSATTEATSVIAINAVKMSEIMRACGMRAVEESEKAALK
jgi:hypothetical protein